MSSGKWRPFCLGLNVLTPLATDNAEASDEFISPRIKIAFTQQTGNLHGHSMKYHSLGSVLQSNSTSLKISNVEWMTNYYL